MSLSYDLLLKALSAGTKNLKVNAWSVVCSVALIFAERKLHRDAKK